MVDDVGELIIYAPHIKEISVVHGVLIRPIGYHVRDYFVKQAVNLGYRDPATIDPQAWLCSADPDRLVVPRAGEYLYRLQSSKTQR